MNYKDFEDKEFNFVQKWVILDIEGYDAHVLQDIEQKDNEGEVVIDTDQRDTPMHATN